jgi:hypothetical protein
MRNPWIPLLFLALISLGGCDETDLVAIRIHLREDLGGTVTTSALAQPSADGAIQSQSHGASWESRVDVACAAGRFDKLSDLKLADLSFTAGEAGQGIYFIKVVLPRGANVQWPRALVPLSSDERTRASAALDPSGKSKGIGAMIKLEIELPAAVVSSGLTGRTRGTKVTSEAQVATLLVPFETATTEGESMTWHLTWQQ